MSSGSDARDPTYSGRNRAAWLLGHASLLARQGWSVSAVAAILEHENEAKCTPPLLGYEVLRLADDAVAYAATEEGQRDSVFQRFAQQCRVPLLDDGEIERLPAVEWQVDGILPAQSLALLYGPPGVGKSFLGLDIAFCVQTGNAWQDRRVQRGSVVYVTGEGGAGMSQRVRAWKQSHGVEEVAGVLFHCGPLDVLESDAVSAFIDRIGPGKPRLLILDTLARCMVGGDEDSAKDMGMFVAGIERLRTELGATVLTLHHPTKNNGVERGSGALRGAMDTVLHLTAKDRVITMQCEKQKDAEQFPHVYMTLQSVELTDGTTSCLVEGCLPPQVTLQSNRSKRVDGASTDIAGKQGVLAVLSGTRTGMTPSQMLVALPDVTQRSLYRWLKALRDNGSVTVDKGLYRRSTGPTAIAIPLPRDVSGSGSDT